jgi:fluoroquinolone transport system permease protein
VTYRKKALYYAFLQYLNQIKKDAMLIMLCIAPVLCGLFFRFGIPFIQELLIKYLNKPEILPQYYLLFDLMLGALTPLLYCFAAAYVILGEIDDGLTKYFAVTPIGKRGYLISRLGIPALFAYLVSIAAMVAFRLTNISIYEIILITFLTSILGILDALLVVALSGNKVEGMAVSKLSGLFLLGMPAPFFLTGNIQYALFFLPSFWIAKYAMEKQIYFLAIGLVISIGWLYLLYQKFSKKLK